MYIGLSMEVTLPAATLVRVAKIALKKDAMAVTMKSVWISGED